MQSVATRCLCVFSNSFSLAYLSGHLDPPTTHVVCANFIHKWLETYSLKATPKYRHFSRQFHLHSKFCFFFFFCLSTAKSKPPQKYCSLFVFFRAAKSKSPQKYCSLFVLFEISDLGIELNHSDFWIFLPGKTMSTWTIICLTIVEYIQCVILESLSQNLPCPKTFSIFVFHIILLSSNIPRPTVASSRVIILSICLIFYHFGSFVL